MHELPVGTGLPVSDWKTTGIPLSADQMSVNYSLGFLFGAFVVFKMICISTKCYVIGTKQSFPVLTEGNNRRLNCLVCFFPCKCAFVRVNADPTSVRIQVISV